MHFSVHATLTAILLLYLTAATGARTKFAVLHDNVHSLTALRHLVHASGTERTKIWLYGDMPRWKSVHATSLWQFDCGKTTGDPTDCVAHQSRLQAALHKEVEVEEPPIGRGRRGHHKHHKHHHHRGKKGSHGGGEDKGGNDPVAVGFGIDLNLWQAGGRAQDFLKRAKALLLALVPDSLIHVALREAHHGAVSPLMADVPGRLVGVARSQFAKDLSNVRPKKRHVHLICPEDGDPENMVRVLKQHHASRKAMLEAVQHAQDKLGLRVLVIDPHQLIPEPNETLHAIYDFLFPQKETGGDVPVIFDPLTDAVEAHNHTFHAIKEAIALPWYVLDECSATIENAKIRLAVAREPSVKDLIRDLEDMQALITRMRRKRSKLHPPPHTRKGRA